LLLWQLLEQPDVPDMLPKVLTTKFTNQEVHSRTTSFEKFAHECLVLCS